VSSKEDPAMNRISPVPDVGIPLTRAVLCPNDDTVYDTKRWRVCPTCQGEDRVWLSRTLGHVAGQRDLMRASRAGRMATFH
jgi:hypothetical protein